MAEIAGENRAAAASIEAALSDLLRATERLHASLADEEGTQSDLAAVFDDREAAFGRLRALRDPATWKLDAAMRTSLERIRELDREILDFGAGLVTAVRGQRLALKRRRSAIQRHASRERDEPRVLTVKA